MAQPPRPAEVLIALQRLGFVDKPSVGDHVDLYKLVLDHPDGQVTIHTGLDMGHCSKRDVSRIRRQTLLKGELWDRALKRDLPRTEYEDLLRATPKPDLVLPWWRTIVSSPPETPDTRPGGPSSRAAKPPKERR